MRSAWYTVPALLLVATLAAAQQGAAPPPAQVQAAVNAQMLDVVLTNWEKSMTNLDSFSAECVRIMTDKTFGTKDEYRGHAKFLKSGQGQPSRALLQLAKPGVPQKFEKYLCTGNFLYIYAPATKVIYVYDLPAQKPGQVAEENFLTFLFGMKAADAKKRYDMAYVPDAKGQKWYHYIRILPRTPQDKADFTEARLTLTASDHMPRQLWYHQPNGNEITWDFPKVTVNAHIPLTEFAAPAVPKDWRMERVRPQSAAANAKAGAAFPVGNKK
jgi:TIGR03009 family protein